MLESARPPRRTAARVAGFGASIFSEMSALARQHGAVNLSQGFPDFASPAWIRDAAKRAIDADLNQYADQPGRAAPARRRSRRRKPPAMAWPMIRTREVTVTSGATEAIFAVMPALLNPGDEVSSSSRATTPTRPASSWPAATPRFVRARGPDWRFDPAALRPPSRPRTRLILRQHPAQSQRQGLQPRRVGGHRGALPAARPDRRDRRGLRAHRLLRPPRTSRWPRCPACASAPSRSAARRRPSA